MDRTPSDNGATRRTGGKFCKGHSDRHTLLAFPVAGIGIGLDAVPLVCLSKRHRRVKRTIALTVNPLSRCGI